MRRRFLSSPTIIPSRPHALKNSVQWIGPISPRTSGTAPKLSCGMPDFFLTSAISPSGRPPPPVSAVTVAGGLPSFTSPADYGYSSIPHSHCVVVHFATPGSVTNGASDLAGARRASTRKRVQAEPYAATSIPSSKHQKLEDPLAGWMMVDPDTSEELTRHQWVEHYPEEFEKRYKKDYQR
ncbi:hypothetical protein B0H13DRAFT_2097713 [Mycena leptocephala]|nr:hypothetical protein B0H13DRAFT_2097713 [Mycena leptocephala]